MFLEVDHGPFMVDNNLFLSNGVSLHINSQGGAIAHNLLCGEINVVQKEMRLTPFLKPHSTEIAGMHGNPTGDMRFYNNLFVEGGDLSQFNNSDLPSFFGGNVFLNGAHACTQEASPLIQGQFDPHLQLSTEDRHMQLEITLDRVWATGVARKLVTTAILGKARIPDLSFVRTDGAPYALDTDFSGRRRDVKNPFPGPFELSGKGSQRINVRIETLRKPAEH
jgi:alpha-N-arabinofuranosidase